MDKCVVFSCEDLKEHWNFLCALKVVVYVYSVCDRIWLSSCVGFLKVLFFFLPSHVHFGYVEEVE